MKKFIRVAELPVPVTSATEAALAFCSSTTSLKCGRSAFSVIFCHPLLTIGERLLSQTPKRGNETTKPAGAKSRPPRFNITALGAGPLSAAEELDL